MSLIQEALKRQQAEEGGRPPARRPALVRYVAGETPDRTPPPPSRSWVSAVLLLLLLVSVAGLAGLILLGPEGRERLLGRGGEPAPVAVPAPAPPSGRPDRLPPEAAPLDAPAPRPADPPPPPPSPTPSPAPAEVVWPRITLQGVAVGESAEASWAFLNQILVPVGGSVQGVRLAEVREGSARLEYRGEERWLLRGETVGGRP